MDPPNTPPPPQLHPDPSLTTCDTPLPPTAGLKWWRRSCGRRCTRWRAGAGGGGQRRGGAGQEGGGARGGGEERGRRTRRAKEGRVRGEGGAGAGKRAAGVSSPAPQHAAPAAPGAPLKPPPPTAPPPSPARPHELMKVQPRSPCPTARHADPTPGAPLLLARPPAPARRAQLHESIDAQSRNPHHVYDSRVRRVNYSESSSLPAFEHCPGV